MITDYTKIFNESKCLTHDEMTEYLSGNISKSDKQRIEMHLSDCEMCTDELDGLILMNDTKKLNEIITSLNSKIIKSVNPHTLIVKPNLKFNIIRISAIAASAVLIIFSGIYLYFISINRPANLAEMNKSTEMKSDAGSKTTPNLLVDSQNSISLSEKSNTEDRIGNEDKIKTETVISTEEEANEYYKKGENEEKIDNTITAGDEISKDLISDLDLQQKEEDLANNPQNNNIDDIVSVSDSEKSKNDKKKNMFGYNSRSVPAENNIVGRNSEDKYISLKTSALFSYDGKVWSEALDSFNQYLVHNPNDIESIYKAGMCNYHLKNYSQAINQFNTVITQGSGRYFDDAEWYKTQSYIKQNAIESAKQLLKQIVSKNGKYKNEAQKLLNELNQ